MKTLKNKNLIAGILIGISISLLLFSAQAVYANFFNRNIGREQKINYILDVLDEHYVGEYEEDELMEDMYKGLVAGIDDPYTTYMDKDTFTTFTEQTQGTYVGIGAVVSGDNPENQVEIVTPYEGSPSYEAGLEPGYRITHVNGTEVFGDNLDEAVSLIKGKEGTTVTLTVIDNDGVTKDMELVRREIDIPTVSHEMLENNTGYIKITNFDRVTTDQYFDAFDDLTDQGMESLIIDLRDNPGGLLDVVVSITDSLVPEGNIVYTEDKEGNQEFHVSDANQIDIPLVILVNEYSASASEVLTGAVKDYGVGTIVGENTYGKGIVQNIYPIPDGSAVKVTMAKYYTPSGVCIQDIGIMPDVVVPYDEIENGLSSTLSFEEDVQLQEAYNILNN